jgi:hypothetical protein
VDIETAIRMLRQERVTLRVIFDDAMYSESDIVASQQYLENREKFKQAAEKSLTCKVKSPIRLKDGNSISVGTEVVVQWDQDKPSRVMLLLEFLTKPLVISTIHLHEYFSEFDMPPPRSELAKQAEVERATTPTGEECELEGWAKDGSPSWFLVLNVPFE